MKIGEQARLIQPEIQGEVLDTRFNKSAEALEHMVMYTTPEGENHERWFLESKLEVVV